MHHSYICQSKRTDIPGDGPDPHLKLKPARAPARTAENNAAILLGYLNAMGIITMQGK